MSYQCAAEFSLRLLFSPTSVNVNTLPGTWWHHGSSVIVEEENSLVKFPLLSTLHSQWADAVSLSQEGFVQHYTLCIFSLLLKVKEFTFIVTFIFNIWLLFPCFFLFALLYTWSDFLLKCLNRVVELQAGKWMRAHHLWNKSQGSFTV